MDIRLQVSLKFRFVSFVQFHLSKHSDFLNLAVLMCRCHDSLIGTPAGRRVRGCGHGNVKSGIQGRKEKLLSLYLLRKATDTKFLKFTVENEAWG